MTNRNRILLLDGKNVAFVSRFSKFRSDVDLPDDPQAWVEAIAERIYMLMSNLGGWSFIYLLDSPPYDRSAFYPAYKGERESDSEKGRAQWKAIQKRIIATLPTARQAGYEADDLIARYCQRYGNSPDYEIIICSADKDMVQLLDKWNNVAIWKTHKSEWQTLPPYDQAVYLALIGDDSDNISGITGEKGALKIMGDPAALEDLLDRPYKPKVRDTRAVERGQMARLPETNREVFARNLKLVSLLGPHVALPVCPIDPFPTEPINLLASLSALTGRPWSPPVEQESFTPDSSCEEPEETGNSGMPIFPFANPFALAH